MKPPERELGLTRAWTLGRAAGLALKGILPLAVLGAAWFGYAQMQASRPEMPAFAPSERTFTVETVTADYGTHQPGIRAFGNVTAGRQVALRALVGGEVVSVGDGLRDGGTVTAGEALVTVDTFDYEGALVEAKADLAEAQARRAEIGASIDLQHATIDNSREQLEIAERDLERAQTLSDRGSMAQQSLETRQLTVVQRRLAVTTADSTLAILRAQLEQLEAQISRLEWRVRLAERNLANVVLKAPFDAYVGSVDAEIGKLLNVNDVVAVLIDRNQFDVRFSLTDAQFGRLTGAGLAGAGLAGDGLTGDGLTGDGLTGGLIGRPVAVTWQVGGEPRRYRATIVRIAPEIAAQRGGVDIYARIDPSDDTTRLRPGAFVEVRLDDRPYDRVVRVPGTALYGTDIVYVVVDGRLAARRIEIVGYDGADLLVRGEIADGERIVTTRITEAGDGVRVIDQSQPGEPEASEPPASSRIAPAEGGRNG